MRVKTLTQLINCTMENLDTRDDCVLLDLGRALEGFHQRKNVAFNVIAAVSPCVIDGIHELQKRGFWEIGAAIEGLTFRGQKDGHGPAATACHCLYSVHVYGVHIRPLFSVHFDVDEKRVHQCCGLDVFEAFVCHDVAPMASRISHR